MFSQIHATALQRPSDIVTGPAKLNLRTMFARQPVESFEPGEAIFREGDRAAHVFEIREGVVRIVKILSDGRRVITAFMHEGDLVSISLQEHYLYTAEAVTPVKIRRYPRNRFQDEMVRFPELRPQLFSHLCEEMAAAQEQMVLLARKNAEEKVCSFILKTARRARRESRREVALPMSRLDMADHLGLTIETVSRTMTSLANQGVVRPAGRHSITVRCMRQLARLAGESDDEDTSSGEQAGIRRAVWPQ